MRIRLASVLGAACAASGATLLTASCSLLAYRDDAQHALSSNAQRPTHAHRIVQLDFGRSTSYGICIEPACPAVTPKTVAAPIPAQPSAAKPASLLTAGRSVEHLSSTTASTADHAAKSERLLLQFPSGASNLDAKAKLALDKLLPAARKAGKIIILGRTDNVGSAKANDAIAVARALQVRDYLRSRMKDVNNVIAIDARGSCCFQSNNDSPEGRQANRRVEVVFSYRG